MKKLLLAVLLSFIPALAHAAFPIFGTVKISTDTTYAPTQQTGAINLSSGTIATLISSSATISTATVTIISASSATFRNVTVSSTTILPNATFYPGAFPVLGNATFSSAGYLIGTVVQSSSTQIVTSSATTSTTYVGTGLFVTITPKGATHQVRVCVSGDLQSSNPATGDVLATLFRGATDLYPGTSGLFRGFGAVGNGGVSAGIALPSGTCILDSPATTSAVTYQVKILSNNGSPTATWGGEAVQNMVAEEFAK